MADINFHFDPICPWAWITSRWVTEVQQLRNYDVSWKFISLKMINESTDYSKMSPGHLEGHVFGLEVLRIASAARTAEGNPGVASVYTAFGTAVHTNHRREEAMKDSPAFYVKVLTEAGLPVKWAESSTDTAHDEVIRFESKAALERTGKDVGTPIITFNPQTDREASLFGPVISKIPRGEEAVRLWDAVQIIAESGVSEIKRTLRDRPQYD